MIYCPVTGVKLSAFTVDELMARDCTLEEAVWLAWGTPVNEDECRVRLASLDGFRVRLEWEAK